MWIYKRLNSESFAPQYQKTSSGQRPLQMLTVLLKATVKVVDILHGEEDILYKQDLIAFLAKPILY